MLERARPLLSFKLNRLRRKVIEITLPESCDKKMQRDGIEPKPNLPGVGEKAWWAQQMLGLIPPGVWARESGWTINELIEVAKRSDWKGVLLDGWSQAAWLHRDAEWAEALLAEAYKRGRIAPIQGGQPVTLFQVLPQTRREAFVLEILKADSSKPMTNAERIYIESCGRRWGMALSSAVIDHVLRFLSAEGADPSWTWLHFMAMTGCRLDPSLISETISRLTGAAPRPDQRPPAIERLLDFLQFRHDMLKEFN
jgi:hypothetical protein